MHEPTRPPADPTRGRHAASRPRGTAPLGRRRWLVTAAIAAACAALLAPPPGSGTATASADAKLPKRLSPQEVLSRLSIGAPAGAVTLVSTPVHVAGNQPPAPTVITGLAANGIPNVALNAYRVAAARMDRSAPCGIDWSLLAGIGRVESNHGRFGGATLNSDGTSAPRIIGPSLDGKQFAFIRDTDHGQWDGDPVQDRAVGPMQFIPATWRAYGADGNGDGVADPFNINDAALAAAHYLCVAGGEPEHRRRTAAGGDGLQPLRRLRQRGPRSRARLRLGHPGRRHPPGGQHDVAGSARFWVLRLHVLQRPGVPEPGDRCERPHAGHARLDRGRHTGRHAEARIPEPRR